jgi:hypothetical protein
LVTSEGCGARPWLPVMGCDTSVHNRPVRGCGANTQSAPVSSVCMYIDRNYAVYGSRSHPCWTEGLWTSSKFNERGREVITLSLSSTGACLQPGLAWSKVRAAHSKAILTQVCRAHSKAILTQVCRAHSKAILTQAHSKVGASTHKCPWVRIL